MSKVQEMIKTCIECDGMEVHKDQWDEANELVDEGEMALNLKGRFALSGARGPGRVWRRLTLEITGVDESQDREDVT